MLPNQTKPSQKKKKKKKKKAKKKTNAEILSFLFIPLVIWVRIIYLHFRTKVDYTILMYIISSCLQFVLNLLYSRTK